VVDNNKITQEILYQFLVLKVLIELGGQAERDSVLHRIKTKYRHWLTEKDLASYESGSTERWKNHISFARQHLKERGLLEKNLPRGVWKITDEGRKKYKEWRDFIQANLSQK